MKKAIQEVIDRTIARSRKNRDRYRQNFDQARTDGPVRHTLPCSQFFTPPRVVQ